MRRLAVWRRCFEISLRHFKVQSTLSPDAARVRREIPCGVWTSLPSFRDRFADIIQVRTKEKQVSIAIRPYPASPIVSRPNLSRAVVPCPPLAIHVPLPPGSCDDGDDDDGGDER
jgi:hypothetical protein